MAVALTVVIGMVGVPLPATGPTPALAHRASVVDLEAPDEPTSPAPDRAWQGRWGPVEEWPLVAIHAAVTNDGRVVTYGTTAEGQQTGRFTYDVWTPQRSAASGHLTLPNTTETDLFCNLQLNRSDTGELLMFGGDDWTGTGTTNTGNADIVAYDPATGAIRTLPGMHRPRWYGTGTTLADGSVYVQGGLGGEDHPEHWTPDGGSVLLDVSTADLDYWYPRNFLLPDGRVFGYDVYGRMYFLSPDLSQRTDAGSLEIQGHLKGSSAVMFEPGRILQFGGQSTAAFVIDVTGPEPIVTRTGSMTLWRRWVNATLLPDGRVLATGGATRDAQAFPDDPIDSFQLTTEAQIWDPGTGAWTDGGSAAAARLYHSTSILLPDGRVLTAGGGAPGPVTNADAELYWPDYLLTSSGAFANRPTIDAVSATTVAPGDPLDVIVGGSTIERVTLVKAGASTHSFDMDQRFVEVGFQADGDRLHLDLPDRGTVLTPGPYLLTVIDRAGVPSVSEMIQVVPTGPTAIHSGVVVHREPGFQGPSWSPPAGTSGWMAVANSIVGDDAISSIEVRGGATVRVCAGADGGGPCLVIEESMADLGSLDDAISYLEVVPPPVRFPPFEPVLGPG